MNAKNKKSRKPEGLYDFIYIVVICVAAFIAALFFRRSAGIISMLPVSFALMAFIAFLPQPGFAAKASVVILMLFTVNTVEQKEIHVTLLYTALCLLSFMGFYAGKKLLKNKKAAIPVICSAAIVSVGLSFIFIGNPIRAIEYSEKLTEYTDKVYPENGSIDGKGFEISEIYYNYKTKAYAVDIVSGRYPTEGGIISTSGGAVYDGFKKSIEEKVAEPFVLEITRILRNGMPDASFSVELEGYSLNTGETLYTLEKEELAKRFSYKIHIYGIQLQSEWKDAVTEYLDVLDNYEAEYSHIVFNSGTGSWLYRETTVSRQYFKTLPFFYTDFVNTGTSASFNKYIRLIGRK